MWSMDGTEGRFMNRTIVRQLRQLGVKVVASFGTCRDNYDNNPFRGCRSCRVRLSLLAVCAAEGC
jgi:hypothetical protein